MITLPTDALVIKHQAITIHNADWICILMDQINPVILFNKQGG